MNVSTESFRHYNDREIVDALLSDNPCFVNFFFYEQCKPMLSKIAWTIFCNSVSVNDLSHELYIVCKNDNWHKVRTFSFKSSFFSWLRIVAIHHFIRNKDRLTSIIDTRQTLTLRERLTFDKATDKEVIFVLNQMASPTYKEIVQCMYIDRLDDEEIRNRLSLSLKEYRKKKEGAIDQLINIICNEGPTFESIFFIDEQLAPILPVDEDESTKRLISKMDVAILLDLLDNDRYRYIIESLVLKDRKRDEVADELCITVQNLDNLKSRALKKLAQIAKKEMNNGRL